jgi:hypothetical protein
MGLGEVKMIAYYDRLHDVLSGIADCGPEIDLAGIDAESRAFARHFNLPVEVVYAVKYLAENGPDYDELEENAWNVGFADDPENDPTVEADDTICPYDGCAGYESEFSHNDDCPYTISLELLNEWRQAIP